MFFYFYNMDNSVISTGPADFWHADHKNTCGGQFVKILEPPNYKKKVYP